MTMEPITAGDGYSYLTRHIATGDSTELGRQKLSDYYSDKGESPGIWIGSGLPTLGEAFGITDGDEVTAEQMKALFGEGIHPNADMIMRAVASEGGSVAKQLRAVKLGRAFNVHSDATPFRIEVARRFNDYNKSVGAKWNAAIHAEERARIRTDVSREFFVKEHGRAPLDERELSGWTALQSRQRTKDVAGFDCAFAPPKSVSALWALAPLDVARVVEECHDQAVRETVSYLEERAAFARIGAAGVGQVDTHGVLAAAFRHRDSRSGDPHMHTHVVISNPVRVTMPDGSDKWLRLDSHNGMFPMNVPASEHYNTRVDQLLRARLPIDTFDRGDGVMEIAGVDLSICDAWSKRARMIDRRTSELAREFQRKYGREPSPVESLDLRQQANLETRQAKHAPKSHAEQRAEWREFAASRLDPDRWVADALSAPVREFKVTDGWLQGEAASIVEAVSDKRARWQTNHVEAEIQRRIRYAGVRDDDHARVTDGLRERVTGLSIRFEAPPLSAEGLEPDCLRRRDGRSIYHRALGDQFTSQAVLDAEDRILAAAGLTGGVELTSLEVDLALLEAAANGGELNAGQATMVRQIAMSDRRVQLVLAPAGTGKTHAMKTLGRAWNHRPGHHVLGLSPTAAASAKLREEIGTDCDNLAKLKQLVGNPGANPPAWFTSIGPGTLVVVDEAGMASDQDLDATLRYLVDRGAKVLLIGDHKQLPSVASGGVLTDIAAEYGAVTLSHVVRFTDPAEGPASLALRDGDAAALGFYADKGRLHVGERGAVEAMAYEAWARDVADGKDSLLLAGSRDTVADLNSRARADRLGGSDPGLEVELADGLKAGVGDTVCSRHNDRRLVLSSHDWVRNGDRWTVEGVREDGSLWVRHLQLRRPVLLPAEYVREHVELGYARTVHSAEGLTAGGKRKFGSCHTIFTGLESRELLYTAATRGRDENHVWLSTALSGDAHDMVTERGTLPATGLDVARKILARSAAQVSARTAMRDLADPVQRLVTVAGSYEHAVGVAAECKAGEVMAAVDEAADTLRPGLRHADAWPVLRQHLAFVALAGADPVARLAGAIDERELDTARDAAAVLDNRLDKSGRHHRGVGPLPWLSGVPDVLAQDAEWGPFLTAAANDVDAVAGQVRGVVETWTATSAPVWARPFVVDHPGLCADLAVWRAARGVEESDRRPAGPTEYAAWLRRTQDGLLERVRKVTTDPATAAGRWREFCEGVDPHIVQGPYWLEFAANLDRMSRAGVDVKAMVTAAAESPLPAGVEAEALWWRMTRDLDAGAVEATGGTGLVRPGWTVDVFTVLGDDAALRVLADPAWPKLVAAVENAQGESPQDSPLTLLSTAHAMITRGHEDEPLPASELAGALAWRVEILARGGEAYLPVVEAPVVDELPPDPLDEAPVEAVDLDALFAPKREAGPSLDELRAAADAARAEFEALRALVDADRGPAMVAAEVALADLRARRDVQKPFANATVDAEQFAAECEVRAVEAERRLADVMLARPELVEPDALDAAVADATGLPVAPSDLGWRLERAEASMSAVSLRAAAESARSEAAARRGEWSAAAGGDRRMVTESVYSSVRSHVAEIDGEALSTARQARDRAVSAVDRRESSQRLREERAQARRDQSRRRSTTRGRGLSR